MPSIDLTNLNQEKLDALAVQFANEFTVAEGLRQNSKETEWIQSLRQSKSIHDPEIKFGPNDSQIYSQYTRSKEVPLRAKLNQHLIPEKERNFEVKSTPKPRVTDSQLQDIIIPLIKKDENGAMTAYPTENEIDLAIKAFSEEKALEMTVVIDDNLIEGKYRLKQKDQIKSGIRYGTGIIKGPLVESYSVAETVFKPANGTVSKIRDYIKNLVTNGGAQPSGTWQQTTRTKYRPIPEFVSIWRFYPDMSATELGQCNYVYELYAKTKHQMRELAERSDFYSDIIYDILEKHPKGNYKLRTWENDLKTATTETDGQPKVEPTNLYEVIERNGFVDGADLQLAGIISDVDVKTEYFCSFWFCANRCIKVSIWPKEVMKTLPDLYHLFYYEKDETSIFGTGLPKIIRDRQLAMNAGERNMLSHAAWLKGPCGEINLSLLHPDSMANAQAFGPLTFLGKIGFGNDAMKKVLELYSIEDHMNSYISLMGFQRSQGDFESSLPSSLFGAPTRSDETARGVTVRFENLLDFIKDLARNFDEANTSFIRGVYRWNMKFNDDPTIKGDLEINAIGTVQALIRDAIREHIGFFMQSMPDEMKARFKWSAFAKELSRSMFDDPDKFIFTDKEFDEMQKPMQEKQAQIDQLNQELAIVKGKYDMAKADAMTAKAEKTMAEIPHDVAGKQLDNEGKKADINNKNVDTLQKQVETAHAVRKGPEKEKSK